jgi:hypothetical protein
MIKGAWIRSDSYTQRVTVSSDSPAGDANFVPGEDAYLICDVMVSTWKIVTQENQTSVGAHLQEKCTAMVRNFDEVEGILRQQAKDIVDAHICGEIASCFAGLVSVEFFDTCPNLSASVAEVITEFVNDP